MLLLLFRAGESLYAFDAKHIAEVVPKVSLRAIPHAPGYLVGLLGYRGQAIPVIDFRRLIGSDSSRDALSTRLVVIEFTGADGSTRLVGVVAENVSHVVNVEARQIVLPAMSLDEAPYLGSVLQFDEGLVQLVEVDQLLNSRMQDALYGGATEPG